MRVLIIPNTVFSTVLLEKYLLESDVVIAADGGYGRLRFKESIGQIPDFKVDMLVGDMDSTDPVDLDWAQKTNVKIIRFSSHKDATDTELAIDEAIKMSPQSITIIGGIGTRFDHSFANVLLLKKIVDAKIEGSIVTDREMIWLAQGEFTLEGKPGQTFSVLPMYGGATVTYEQGAEYPLNKKVLPQDSGLGVSNVMTQKEVKMLIEGTALVIKSGANIAIK